MANAEAKMFADSIIDKVERIVACVDGRPTEELDMRPPIKESNSLLVLAIHTMGNVEQAVFEVLFGEPGNRDRDAEFASSGGTAEGVRQKWEALKARIQPALEGLTAEQLDAEYEHPRRGPHTGRSLLLFTATHASEHVGHAELTRDWIDT